MIVTLTGTGTGLAETISLDSAQRDALGGRYRRQARPISLAIPAKVQLYRSISTRSTGSAGHRLVGRGHKYHPDGVTYDDVLTPTVSGEPGGTPTVYLDGTTTVAPCFVDNNDGTYTVTTDPLANGSWETFRSPSRTLLEMSRSSAVR